MPEKCMFPGCNYSYLNSFKYNLEKQSVHRVPNEQKEAVTKFLKMDGANTRPLFLCSAHFRDDAFLIGNNQKPWVRKDIPFTELLRPLSTVDDSQLNKNLPQIDNANRRKTVGNPSSTSILSRLCNELPCSESEEYSESEEPATPSKAPQAVTAESGAVVSSNSKASNGPALAKEPVEARTSATKRGIEAVMATSLSEPVDFESDYEEYSDEEAFFDAEQLPKEVPKTSARSQPTFEQAKCAKLQAPAPAAPIVAAVAPVVPVAARNGERPNHGGVQSRLLQLQIKVSESDRKNRELESALSKANSAHQAAVAVQDKEIAALKHQIQQLQAETRALAETNKALSVDLTVYRKLIQFESQSSSATKDGCSWNKSPVNQWRHARQHSAAGGGGGGDDSIEIIASPNRIMRVATPSRNGHGGKEDSIGAGKLDDLKKWLKNSKPF